ncbi:MAG TPA: GAF domain-containing protein [Vicinamibacterales bacterium]|nr:GAF domain-containing protein [Vicinamibacterales bacterium]
MSDTIEDQLKRAFDALAERVRASVSDQVDVTVAQLSSAVESAKTAAALAAATDASARAEQTVTTRLTEEFQRREEQIREQARAEWFEAGLQQARAEGRAALSAREAELQSAADVALKAAADAASVAMADAASKAAADASAAAAASIAKAESAAAEAAALVSVANAVHRAAFERLLQSVRTLDGTASLTQSLDALFAAAREDAQRVALFLLRNGMLRVWSHAGFDAITEGAEFELPLAEAGAAGEAIRTGATERVGPGAEGRPAFAGEATGTFIAVPLRMNGQTIAVLCGEQTSADETIEWLASAWEVLARHAARVLESLIGLRLAQAGSQPHSVPAMPSQ